MPQGYCQGQESRPGIPLNVMVRSGEHAYYPFDKKEFIKMDLSRPFRDMFVGLFPSGKGTG